MKYPLLFILCLFPLLQLFGQPLQKHQGKLQNGFTDPGDVTFTYRVDEKTDQQVKQGNFRYSVKAKDDQYRFNHNVTGSYANNLKEGAWSYKINQKDFRLQHQGLYTTGTVSLDASYRQGFPDGTWNYQSVLKNRPGEKKQANGSGENMIRLKPYW